MTITKAITKPVPYFRFSNNIRIMNEEWIENLPTAPVSSAYWVITPTKTTIKQRIKNMFKKKNKKNIRELELQIESLNACSRYDIERRSNLQSEIFELSKEVKELKGEIENIKNNHKSLRNTFINSDRLHDSLLKELIDYRTVFNRHDEEYKNYRLIDTINEGNVAVLVTDKKRAK